MRTKLRPFLLLILLSMPVMAAEPRVIPFGGGDNLLIPKDSPVHYSKGSSVIAFKGRFLLTGTYYYGDNDFNDSGDDNPKQYQFEPEAYIIPDTDVAARLPHFQFRNNKRSIIITNPDNFAKAVVPPAQAKQVRCRQCGDATGHIEIWVDQFSASIECDAPAYEVRFLSGC